MSFGDILLGCVSALLVFWMIFAINNSFDHKQTICERTKCETLTITAYTCSPDETDETPHRTATMQKPVVGKTCAVSRDLLHWLGGWVYIEGIGVRKVDDLMNKRYKKALDVLVATKKSASLLGSQEMKVVFLGR